MKPIKWKHSNTVYAENQDEYRNLPSLKLDTPEGHVISCWKMSFKERMRVLIFGRVWMNLLSFNRPLTPSLLTTQKKDLYHHPDFDKKWWSFIKWPKILNLKFKI